MKPFTFTVPVRNLKEAIPELRKVIQRKSTLPVLETVLIERDKGATRLTGTDLDIRLTCTIPSDLPEPVSDLGRTLQANRSDREDGAICVPLKDLATAVKNADPATDITFSADPKKVTVATGVQTNGKETTSEVTNMNGKLTYSFQGNKATLTGFDFDPDDLPPGRDNYSEAFLLPTPARDAILTALQCASIDETRYVLVGVYVDPDRNAVVATNGKELIHFDTPLACMGQTPSFIMPSKTVNTLSGRIAKLPWSMSVAYAPPPSDPSATSAPSIEALKITAGNWTLESKTIEGNYPNWPQVVPEKDSKAAFLYKLNAYNRANASDMLKRLPLNPAEKSNSVKVEVKGDKMRFSKGDNHFDITLSSSNCKERFTCGDRIFWQRMIDLGVTEIRLENELAPVAGYKPGMTYVFMPMRIAA